MPTCVLKVKTGLHYDIGGKRGWWEVATVQTSKADGKEGKMTPNTGSKARGHRAKKVTIVQAAP